MLAHTHNRDTVLLRSPLRAQEGYVRLYSEFQNLLFHVLRRKPYRCRYFTIEFSLFSLSVAVSTHLCVACHHFCSIVAVQRPCRLSEFTLTGLLP